MSESVTVVSRFRKEFNKPIESYEPWEFQPENGYIKHIGKQKEYNFDYALTMDVDQEFMYEKSAKRQIDDFINGYNVTIFAYGKTGSGKTFSMTGDENVTESLAQSFNNIPENVQRIFGIIPRACIQIFQGINEFIKQGCQCKLTSSYVEVYMEKIYDLLGDRREIILKYLRDTYIMDKLTKRECMTPEEIFRVIADGTANKKVAATAQNARSSRSHTILSIELERTELSGTKTSSRLYLVDLAGSERQSKTHAEGLNKEEGIKINLSLTTLGAVIMEISKQGTDKTPIRLKDSKLTMILKESFIGNSRLTLLVTASILKENADEAVNSLDFAKRAKMIKKKVSRNVVLSAGELEYLSKALKDEILSLRGLLIKAGLNYNILKDKKILSFIKNEEYVLDGQEAEISNIGSEINNTSTSSHNVLHESFSATKGDIIKRKRQSILNSTEEEIIMKYCEIRAKFENLEQATKTKLIDNSFKEREAEDLIEQMKIDATQKITENDELRFKELNELKNRLEKEKEDYQKKEAELGMKIAQLENDKFKLEDDVVSGKKEIEGIQEFMSLVENDNTQMQEKLDKKRKKYKTIKEKFSTLNSEKEQVSKDLANAFTELDLLKLDKIQQSQEMENFKTQNELLKSEIKSINETINKKIESTATDAKNLEKLYQDLLQKDALNETRLRNEEEKAKLYEEKNSALNDENGKLQRVILENEQSERNFNEKISHLTQELNDKDRIIAELKETLKEKDEKIENYKANSEVKAEVEKYKNENEDLKKELTQIRLDLEFKEKAANDVDIKLKEVRAEYSILQNSYQRLSTKLSEIELELESTKKKSMLTRNSIIKEKVNMDKAKNIFGFILKKVDNNFLKEARAQEKKNKDFFAEINKDKIDELKNLRGNIISLSPKTVSSRSSINDLPDFIDFEDDEGFEKLKQAREIHEKEREERKRKEYEIFEKEKKEAEN